MSDKITVIIVEDEERIRNSLHTLIEEVSDDFEVVGCAFDGNEALELIKICKPQLMFTDIQMPNMNGIQLLEQVHELYPELVTVVISGHSDFQYAQKSMKYGVYNYLLKPVERQQLTETLREVKGVVSRTIYKNNRDVFYSENYNMFTDDETLFQAAIICIGNLIYNDSSDSVHRHYDELMRSVNIKSTLEQCLSVEWFLADEYTLNEKMLVVKSSSQDVSDMYKLFQNKLSSEMDVNISLFGLEEPMKRSQLPVGFKTLRHLLRENLVAGMGNFKMFSEPYSIRDDILDLTKAKLKSATKNFLSSNDADKYLKDINSVFNNIILNDHSQAVLEKTCTNVFTLLELSEKIFDSVKFDAARNSMMDIISISHDKNDLCELLAHEMSLIIDQSEYTKTSTRDDELLRYVDENYLKIEGLDEVADKFGYNYSYVSRMFKKLTGCSMNQYIKTKRITLAKSLIKQYDDTSMTEIGLMCGYEDSKYFSRVFKSETGITPSEYRSGI